jgi:Circadian oscillating protein COP23
MPLLFTQLFPMKRFSRRFLSLFAIPVFVGPLVSIAPAQAITFPNVTFECPKGGRIMFAKRTVGKTLKVPVVQFTSMGKRSATDRCQEVTARFNFLNTSPSATNLAYLTTGVRRGQPIVCSVQNYGDICDDNSVQLLTLNPRDRSPERRDQALALLLVRLHNAIAQTPVLLDSQPRLYVNFQDMMTDAFKDAEGDTAAVNSVELPVAP